MTLEDLVREWAVAWHGWHNAPLVETDDEVILDAQDSRYQRLVEAENALRAHPAARLPS